MSCTHELEEVKLLLIASDVLFSKVSRSFQSKSECGNDDRQGIPHEASRGSPTHQNEYMPNNGPGYNLYQIYALSLQRPGHLLKGWKKVALV